METELRQSLIVWVRVASLTLGHEIHSKGCYFDIVLILGNYFSIIIMSIYSLAMHVFLIKI